MNFTTLNPHSGEVLEAYNYIGEAEIDSRLQKSFSSFEVYRRISLSQRNAIIVKLAENLRKNSQKLALQMTLEMGKPIKQSLAEVEKCAATCEYFAKKSEEFLRPTIVGAQTVYKISLGPILGVMPWNFPYWQVIRFLVPSIAIGNPILLKHADITAGCAQLFAQVVQSSCEELDLPSIIENLVIDHDQAAKVIADPRVRAVTFTGSIGGGKKVAETAGQNAKKIVLELGGSDPYIVLNDADLDRAAKLCAESRTINTGQSCVAGKRFIVEEKVYKEFMDLFVTEFKAMKRDDPKNEGAQLGPLAHPKFKKSTHEMVEKLVQAKARLIYQEESSLLTQGAHYPVQVIACEDPHQEIIKTGEFFAPVALVFKAANRQQAIDIANSTQFGLGSGVFSKDPLKLEEVAQKLESGMVAMNDYIKSTAETPFGGVKKSGFGRELGSAGFNEFINFKTVTQNHV